MTLTSGKVDVILEKQYFKSSCCFHLDFPVEDAVIGTIRDDSTFRLQLGICLGMIAVI